VRLIKVLPHIDEHLQFLYGILSERDVSVNISHKEMPSFEEHAAFCSGNPYEEWLLMTDDSGQPVGACYITKMGEIGIQIARGHQRRGYARTALNTLIEMHKGRRLLANIAPGNEPSRKLFEGFGFKLIQHTYELDQG